jgi:hypothetical protein
MTRTFPRLPNFPSFSYVFQYCVGSCTLVSQLRLSTETVSNWRIEIGAFLADTGGHASGPFNLTNVGQNNSNETFSVARAGLAFPPTVPRTAVSNGQARIFMPPEAPPDSSPPTKRIQPDDAMNPKLLSYLLRFLSICFAIALPSCATVEQVTPLGPNEARITGRAPTLWVSHQVVVARADQPESKYSQTLVLPAGKQKLKLRYGSNNGTGGALVQLAVGLAATKYDKTIQINAVAGHQYYVDCVVKTLLIGFGDIDYKVTDTTTGTVVLETHGQKP